MLGLCILADGGLEEMSAPSLCTLVPGITAHRMRGSTSKHAKSKSSIETQPQNWPCLLPFLVAESTYRHLANSNF